MACQPQWKTDGLKSEQYKWYHLLLKYHFFVTQQAVMATMGIMAIMAVIAAMVAMSAMVPMIGTIAMAQIAIMIPSTRIWEYIHCMTSHQITFRIRREMEWTLKQDELKIIIGQLRRMFSATFSHLHLLQSKQRSMYNGVLPLSGRS